MKVNRICAHSSEWVSSLFVTFLGEMSAHEKQEESSYWLGLHCIPKLSFNSDDFSLHSFPTVRSIEGESARVTVLPLESLPLSAVLFHFLLINLCLSPCLCYLICLRNETMDLKVIGSGQL